MASDYNSGVKSRRWPPGRRLALLLAIGFAVFAVYGSLVPLELEPTSVAAAWSKITHAGFVPLSESSKTDLISNVLLFVPIGLCATAAIPYRRPGLGLTVTSVIVVAAVACALGLSIEFLQTFIPARTPSLTDVAAQTVGGLLGAAVWLATGPSFTALLGRLRRAQPRATPFVVVLIAYVAIFAVVQWSPFDLTIRPAEIMEKYRAGRISLHLVVGESWWSLIAEETPLMVLCAPIGWLASVSGGLWVGLRRTAWMPLLFSAVVVCAIEIGQVFVFSRFAQMQDVWIGGAGATVGLLAGARFVRQQWRRPAASAGAVRSGLQPIPSTAAVLWIVIFLVWSWWPFQMVSDVSVVPARLQASVNVPLTNYLAATPLEALANASAKLLMTAVLGALLVAAWPRRGSLSSKRIRTACVLLVIAVLHLLSEAGQLVLATRYPDLTDVFLGIVGGYAGAITAAAISRTLSPETTQGLRREGRASPPPQRN